MFLTKECCKEIIIPINASLKEAALGLEKGGIKLVLVFDENNKLIGTVSDGDLRRGLLGKLNLSSPIKFAMKSNFFSVNEDTSEKKIINLMKNYEISHIPVLDKVGNFIGLHIIDNLAKNKHKKTLPNSALLMAGGRGSRLMPLTKNYSKPMIKIYGKPMLEIILNQCIKAGIVNFYISVHYLSEQIIDYLEMEKMECEN